MKQRIFGTVVAMSALLAGCGGSGDSGTTFGGPATGTVTPTPTAPVTTAGCSLRERQDWAAAQLREWYLFPETLPTVFDP
ncbi:MAG: peptidase S41, partial [Pseudomonadota bacterium]|nr:peptidase S41 [Pseudomonadota bacterium]